MPRERWGVFSVSDHLLPNPFFADVLLYHRLVLPYPAADFQERKRWRKWNLERLDACIEALGGRAYKVFWDEGQRFAQRNGLASARACVEQMKQKGYVVDCSGMTRLVFVPGVQARSTAGGGPQKRLVMSAYSSAARFQEDSGIDPRKLGGGKIKAMFSHRFLVPQCAAKDELKVLKDLVELSSSKEFAEKREMFYQWQEDVLQEKLTAARAVFQTESLLRELDDLTRKVSKKCCWKFACLLLDIGAAFVPMGHTEKIGKGTLKALRFAVDGKEALARAELGSAAMFHDAGKAPVWC